MNLRPVSLAIACSLAMFSPVLPAAAHEGHDHGDSHAAGHDHDHDHGAPAGGHAHEPAQAAGDHHHDAMHGGLVRTAGDHHLELVASRQSFSLWIQDGDQHDLPVKGAMGKLIVKPAGQSPKVFEFRVAGDHLEAPVNLATGGHVPAIVQVVYQGKRLTARFPVDL